MKIRVFHLLNVPRERFFPPTKACPIPVRWDLWKTMQKLFFVGFQRWSIEEYYHDDEVLIRVLLENYGLTPCSGMEMGVAPIRGLILTVLYQERIRERFPEVLQILVNSVCIVPYSLKVCQLDNTNNKPILQTSVAKPVRIPKEMACKISPLSCAIINNQKSKQ